MPNLSWKDYLHYGTSALLIGLAGLTAVGVQLPGVHVDAATAFASGVAGLGVLGAGLKSGATS